MFNVTIIKGKDIFKFVVKILAFVILIYFFKSILIVPKEEKIKLPSIVDKEKMIACIEDNISAMKQINDNQEDFDEKIDNINPLKFAIDSELEVINYIKIKEDNQKENKENQTKEVEKKEDIEQAKTGLTTKVLENNVPERFTNSYKGVQVRNESDYELTEEMLYPNVNVKNKDILIFHTHTCESYTATPNFEYQQTGTYRTTDLNFNVARVGKELKKQLTSYGYNVLQDTTYHDYPAYSGSYGRSLETVKKLLKTNINTDVVIDLHRDAIGDYTYAPTVVIGEEEAAQLMFVIGTDGGGLEHTNWNQNLKFAIKIQEKANELYPGLFKPIILRNSRYNQHLAKGACIIEVGATGNTMEQCLNSMKYLAKVMSEVMK